MPLQQYVIREISALSIIASAVGEYGAWRFSFDATDPSKELLVEETKQDDCAIYHQAMCVLYGENYHAEPDCEKLKDALKAMGMELAFDRINADFSNLIGAGAVDGNTYIGEVHHGAKIEVTEQGTRAGAATAVEFLTDGAAFSERVVTLDRPFVFMIIDTETNIPLFIGALTDIDR